MSIRPFPHRISIDLLRACHPPLQDYQFLQTSMMICMLSVPCLLAVAWLPRISCLSPMAWQLHLIAIHPFPAVPFFFASWSLRPENRWFIPANVIIASCIGCLLGAAVAWLTDCPPQYFRIVAILTGIGTPLPSS